MVIDEECFGISELILYSVISVASFNVIDSYYQTYTKKIMLQIM